MNTQPLSRAPVPIPAPYQTLETYELTAKEEAFGEGEIEVRIPRSYVDGSDEYLTELYRYENGEYIKEQIEGEPNQFHFYVGRYWTEEGKPTGDYKATYVIARAKRAELEKGFKETGGFFNGIYGECPEGTMSSFGKCVEIPSDEKITGQALPAGGEGIKFVSLNAGNASPDCLGYAFKLCSFKTEERVRNQIVNTIKPDLAVIQEVWNGQCSKFTNDLLGYNLWWDKVCSSQLDEKMKKGAHLEQIKRLFTPDLYDTSCAPLSAGGYECIALRKGVFQFEESSTEVATGVATQIANTPDYCGENTAKGKDTGFYGRTVSLVNPKVTYYMPFDLWSAHLASPIGGNHKCRAQQINAIVKAYKNTYRKLLIAGDFNTNYAFEAKDKNSEDSRSLKSLASPFNTPLDNDGNYPTYMVSNQNELTAFSMPINPKKFDHVMSNFADVGSLNKCRRIAVKGLDHRTTSCVLYGFDQSSAEIHIRFMENGSESGQSAPVSAKIFRKGVKMNWVRYFHPIGAGIRYIYLPNSVKTSVKLFSTCQPTDSKQIDLFIKADETKRVNLDMQLPKGKCY